MPTARWAESSESRENYLKSRQDDLIEDGWIMIHHNEFSALYVKPILGLSFGGLPWFHRTKILGVNSQAVVHEHDAFSRPILVAGGIASLGALMAAVGGGIELVKGILLQSSVAC